MRSIETTGSTSGEWPGAVGKRLWRGYRTTKAIAWVIDVGVSKPAWLARYKDQCCGPMSLKDAKTAALAMAKGAFGDYRVADPLSHLNGMSARLLDAEAA